MTSLSSPGLLHFGALALHQRCPLPVGTLHLHPEGLLGGRDFLDRHSGLELLAAHGAFIGVGPGISLHGALRDRGHVHARVVHAVIGVNLLLGIVPQDPDALAGPRRAVALVAADYAELSLEPFAGVGRPHLTAGTHWPGLHLALAIPLSNEKSKPFVLRAGL